MHTHGSARSFVALSDFSFLQHPCLHTDMRFENELLLDVPCLMWTRGGASRLCSTRGLAGPAPEVVHHVLLLSFRGEYACQTEGELFLFRHLTLLFAFSELNVSVLGSWLIHGSVISYATGHLTGSYQPYVKLCLVDWVSCGNLSGSGGGSSQRRSSDSYVLMASCGAQ